MSRRRKSAGHVNHERWLVSYADFITLLFAFFVVLFSSSQVDKRKVGKISVAMQEAFQQMGIFQSANSRTPMVTTDPLPAENVQLIEDGRGISGRGKKDSPFEKMMGSPHSPKDMGTLQKQLSSALGPEIQRHEVASKPMSSGQLIVFEIELSTNSCAAAWIRTWSAGARLWASTK